MSHTRHRARRGPAETRPPPQRAGTGYRGSVPRGRPDRCLPPPATNSVDGMELTGPVASLLCPPAPSAGTSGAGGAECGGPGPLRTPYTGHRPAPPESGPRTRPGPSPAGATPGPGPDENGRAAVPPAAPGEGPGPRCGVCSVPVRSLHGLFPVSPVSPRQSPAAPAPRAVQEETGTTNTATRLLKKIAIPPAMTSHKYLHPMRGGGARSAPAQLSSAQLSRCSASPGSPTATCGTRSTCGPVAAPGTREKC